MTRSALLLVPALALAGCSLVIDDQTGDLQRDANAKRDVTLSLRAFDPHVGQLLSIQFVRPELSPPQISSQTIVDPVPTDCMDIRMRRGAPFAATRVDFYADLNMNRVLDTPGEDHTWREELEEDGSLLFVHDVQFADLMTEVPQVTQSPWEVNITGAEAHDGALVTALLFREEPVSEDGEIRLKTVPAMYVTQVVDGTIAFSLPNAVDPGNTFDIALRIGDRALDCAIAEQRAPNVLGDPLVVSGALSDLDCAPGTPPDCAALEAACTDGDRASCADLSWECAFVDCAR